MATPSQPGIFRISITAPQTAGNIFFKYSRFQNFGRVLMVRSSFVFAYLCLTSAFHQNSIVHSRYCEAVWAIAHENKRWIFVPPRKMKKCDRGSDIRGYDVEVEQNATPHQTGVSQNEGATAHQKPSKVLKTAVNGNDSLTEEFRRDFNEQGGCLRNDKSSGSGTRVNPVATVMRVGLRGERAAPSSGPERRAPTGVRGGVPRVRYTQKGEIKR
ncbi:hypothetical protein C8R43DRAFT_940389 [Mycena crocata]|nr:hypothetical protein C8R43DRAFT_940389 [Mycena crocata]